jgi:tetratricopeptide (TPR) repeat protein
VTAAARLLLPAALAFAAGFAGLAAASEQSQRLTGEATVLLQATPPDTVAALFKLREATKADARDARAWALRGGVALTRLLSREALDALERANKLDPKLRNLQFLRGRALQELGRHRESLAAFDKEPNRDGIAAFWFYRGFANKQLKRYSAALADFDKSDRAFEAGRQAAQLHRGDIHVAQRKLAPARAAYQAAASLDPGKPVAEAATARLRALGGAPAGEAGANPAGR